MNSCSHQAGRAANGISSPRDQRSSAHLLALPLQREVGSCPAVYPQPAIPARQVGSCPAVYPQPAIPAR
jgi:hypothetical protein